MKHLLLLETDRIIGQTTRQALAEAGWKVSLCHDAQTAVDALDDQLPDVIVLELQLGLHNGIEFLYELRSYHEWRNIPVMVYTLNKRAQDTVFAEALTQLGVQAVWYKPSVGSAQFVRALHNLFQPA